MFYRRSVPVRGREDRIYYSVWKKIRGFVMRIGKALSILLIIVMVCGTLAACGVSDSDSTDTAAVSASGTVTKKTETKTSENRTTKGGTGTTSRSSSSGNGFEEPGVKIGSGTMEDQTGLASYETIYSYDDSKTDVSLSFGNDGTFSFAEPSTLYASDVHLTINAPEGATVYYTTDGSLPDISSSQVYSEPILFKSKGGSFPAAQMFRAQCVYADGTVSKVAARSYIVGRKLEGRFSTIILAVSGDESELTEEPYGIFAESNFENRGRENERMVYAEAWEPDGTSIFSQFAGIRVYGGYSRRNSIKSFKLFARSSYDENGKTFKINDFGTLKLDGSERVIKKYDKLVVRAWGNDFQFAFIRDELSQTLCKNAGFECYEAVLPVAVYFNGSYYGQLWIHENYCDKYFKEKYGDAEGEFYIVEGGEQEKAMSDDPLEQAVINEFNDTYDELISLDLTNDANYAKVTSFMDVEDYLDYFAWNITINNWDWPNNNYKAFKYVEASAEDLAKEGAAVTPDNEVYDGRWRFLVHDMDYTYNLYDQDKACAPYNNLREILDPKNDRYAPLFDLLMDRADCRSYFRAKVDEYLNGAFSADGIISAYEELHATRAKELGFFYDYLTERQHKGDFTIWTSEAMYAGNEKSIITFAKKRGQYVKKYVDALLPEL